MARFSHSIGFDGLVGASEFWVYCQKWSDAKRNARHPRGVQTVERYQLQKLIAYPAVEELGVDNLKLLDLGNESNRAIISLLARSAVRQPDHSFPLVADGLEVAFTCST